VQAHRTLIAAVHADATDEAAIRAASDTLGRSVGDAAIVVARVKREVLQAAALTPEQQTKLGDIRNRVDTMLDRVVDALQPPTENPRR
jgi:Spy/CpxP family protein refolding chaperone